MSRKSLQILILLFCLASTALLLPQMKLVPQLVCAVAAVLAAALGWYAPERWGRMIVGLIVVITLVAGCVSLSVWIALWLVPAALPEGYRVMPIGQMVLGTAIGISISAILSVLYLSSWRVDERIEKGVLLALALVAPGILLIDWAM